MTKQVKLENLASGLMPIHTSGHDIIIRGISSDSRAIEPGFLFAALPGNQVDGACYIADATANGAVAVLAASDVPIDDAIAAVVIRSDEPRKALAHMAARFYAHQPENVVAITGTNGKTSVASFLRQLWQGFGLNAASIGTIGVITGAEDISLAHTTPEPVELHRILARLADSGTTHLALEASSHGLQQKRLDGVSIKAAAFTNISRDHLDYHGNFENYFTQKLRLFRELLPPNSCVVVDADVKGASKVMEVARSRQQTPLTTGRAGDFLRLVNTRQEGYGQHLTLEHAGKTYESILPLVGDFQVSNALVAAALCIADGAGVDKTISQLSSLKGAKGRLEYVASGPGKAAIFVDYAHTPDALKNVLVSLRPYVRNKLALVFGAGGDRDRGKRPQMGSIAAKYADVLYVTDDNPRSEDPSGIRSQIMASAPGATEIADREEAIAYAIQKLEAGDILLVAGKGHETGQIINDQILPFSDHEVIKNSL
jgi:UDP-N-acetylmuramoyl-L-alanyl-D-glutamate--2,6-diaminopimelate ligase